jgi:cephalosporin hydroxylase
MIEPFEQEKTKNIFDLGKQLPLHDSSKQWIADVSRFKYSYHFTWMGRPIIQFPQDIVAMQEIIWRVKPAVIIETGVAHGGSLILYASLLELIGGAGRVLGIDIDIRQHNREAIENHPLARRIDLLQGSSIDESVISQVREYARGKSPVMVVLDSNHTRDHVARELASYSPLVTKGSYLVVFDTIIEDLPENYFLDRPWGKGNNPKTAVKEFLKQTDRFEIDAEMNSKLLITVAPDGYLRCLKD